MQEIAEKKSQVSYGDLFLRGILKDNPVLALLLGTCPVLAVTTSAYNGIGMGLATLFVLVCSNLVVSLVRNMISDKVRIPVFITIIAGFVTIVQFLIKAYVPVLDESLGIFIPLITVNCIILGRAEAFASKNKPLASIVDGLGMGIGFTLTLFLMGGIREIFGNGTLFSHAIPFLSEHPMLIFILPPGGFFVFGLLICGSTYLIKRKERINRAKERELIESYLKGERSGSSDSCDSGCDGCSSHDSCGMAEFRAQMHLPKEPNMNQSKGKEGGNLK